MNSSRFVSKVNYDDISSLKTKTEIILHGNKDCD